MTTSCIFGRRLAWGPSWDFASVNLARSLCRRTQRLAAPTMSHKMMAKLITV